MRTSKSKYFLSGGPCVCIKSSMVIKLTGQLTNSNDFTCLQTSFLVDSSKLDQTQFTHGRLTSSPNPLFGTKTDTKLCHLTISNTFWEPTSQWNIGFGLQLLQTKRVYPSSDLVLMIWFCTLSPTDSVSHQVVKILKCPEVGMVQILLMSI